MAMWAIVLQVAVASLAVRAHPFVPACIAQQCAVEAKVFATDAYVGALANCTIENFGPCAPKAWECLDDSSCRQVVSCAPSTFETCKTDVWRMVTDPTEREKLMCLMECTKDGQIEPLCALKRCGKAAFECLSDDTCREAAECVPRSMLSCSKPAFDCLFGKDGICRDNLKCLGQGVAGCSAPAVNLLTDQHIADFVTCAGSKCPAPQTKATVTEDVLGESSALSGFGGAGSQLACIATSCGAAAVKLMSDSEAQDMLQCASKPDLAPKCASVWGCLGNPQCAKALSCWSAPFEQCDQDVWHMFTEDAERKRITDGAACLQACQHDHSEDFVEAGFCILGQCGEGLLECAQDTTCRKAVKCLPGVASECALPQLDAFIHQELFRNATECLGLGLESCGRAALHMVQDQHVAEVVSCAATHCTHAPASVIVV